MLDARPYDPLHPPVCFDEKSYQLLSDSRTTVPMRPKHPRQQDYEYRRRGTRNLFIIVEPLAGQLWGSVKISEPLQSSIFGSSWQFCSSMRSLVDQVPCRTETCSKQLGDHGISHPSFVTMGENRESEGQRS